MDQKIPPHATSNQPLSHVGPHSEVEWLRQKIPLDQLSDRRAPVRARSRYHWHAACPIGWLIFTPSTATRAWTVVLLIGAATVGETDIDEGAPEAQGLHLKAGF